MCLLRRWSPASFTVSLRALASTIAASMAPGGTECYREREPSTFDLGQGRRTNGAIGFATNHMMPRGAMMVDDASWLDAAGRMLVAAFFLVAGLINVTPAQIKHHIGRLTDFRVPFPALAFWIGMTLQFTGCALLVSGWRADVGVYCL